MIRYIILARLTEKATQDLKGMAGRVRQARQRVEGMGGTWVGWYMTEGHYDVISIVESPDDQTALAGLLGLAHEGYLRTETLRAFTLEEVEPILQHLQ